jgi:hypothetical protein
MTDCCSVTTSDRTPPKTAVCPRNGRTYAGVERRTVLHHVCQPWARALAHQGYYFCDDANCDVVYFGEDQSLLIRSDLRGDVGQKSHGPDKTLCYCFDINAADIQAEDVYAQARAFVIEQTRNATCNCAVRNPSGRCCLKDFPKESLINSSLKK